MKKLFFIFAVALSTVVNAQIDSTLEQRIDNRISISQSNFIFKTGDNDALLVNGLLKSFISDTSIKYMYTKLSPIIGNLKVTRNGVVIDRFDQWIKQNFSIYNSNNYYVKYIGTDSKINNNSEDLYIYDARTNNIIRVITIWYSDIDHSTGMYMNVISINDVLH